MRSYKSLNDENKPSHHHIKPKSDLYNNIINNGNAAPSIQPSTKTTNYKSTGLSDSHLGSLQQREVLSDLTSQVNYKSRLKSQQQQQQQQPQATQPSIHSYPYAHHHHHHYHNHQRSSSNSNSNRNSTSSIGSSSGGVSASGATLSHTKLQIYKQAAQNLHHYKKPRLEKVLRSREYSDLTDEDLRITSDEGGGGTESSDDKENRYPQSQTNLHLQQNQHLTDLHNRLHDDARYHQQQQLPLRSHERYEMHFKEDIDEIEDFTGDVHDDYQFEELEEEEDDDELQHQLPIKQSITRDKLSQHYNRNDEDLQTEKEVSMETTIRQGDSLSVHEEEEEVDEEEAILCQRYEQQHQQQAVSRSHPQSNRQLRTDSVIPMKPLWDLSIKMELKRIVDKFSRTTLDENDEDTYDASMVAEYAPEIFNYMRSLEEKYKPDPHYMEHLQDELRWGMRAVLIDWVVQVHGKFNLLPETLFLTVNYIDRFLSKRKVSLSRFQLVGAVAFFIAAKYEEINCPTVQEVAFMADNAYTIDEFLKAERFMVDVLEFDMGWPGPMSFLRRTSKADDYDYETRTLAKYFLEITIMDARFVASPPSWLAAGAHYLSRVLLSRGEWTEAHVFYSGYTERQLRPLAEQLLENCRFAEKNHKAIFEKYLERRFRRSSLYVREYFENF